MRKQKNGNSIMDDQLSNRINSMYANQTLEKDNSKRQMMMHQERLNITRQDRVALEQKAAQTREQVRLLKEQTKAWAAKNAKFLGENALAQRQYEFQHSELVSKKEKFNRMSEKIEDSVSARQSTLSYQQEQVLRLRGATPSDPNSVVTDLFRNEERSRRFAANADEFVVERADVLLAHSVGCIEQWVQQVGMLEDVDRRKSSRLAAHLGISSLDLPPPSQACGGSSQAHEVDVNGQEEA